jgi:phosphoribosylformylglycinamidine cyclo-ligase
LSISYKDAGVDLQEAESSTRKIAQLAKSTFNKNVVQEIGLFGGYYTLDIKKYPEPVLVTSVDGVGTKLKVAFMMDKHDTVGQDLVNHCVNDIMTSGADPLCFLDYLGTLKLSTKVAEQIIGGMAKACKENGCALIGGETAEMPGFYLPGEYDLVGSIVGVVNKSTMLNGSAIQLDDVLVGLPSNGLHTNGYSLARKVIFEVGLHSVNTIIDDLGETWGEVLLKTHRSYQRPINAVKHISGLAGISHITGGGIEGNTKRLLRNNLSLHINWDSWQIPIEFKLIQEMGDIHSNEMRKAFNMGIGLVFVVQPNSYDNVVSELKSIGEKPIQIGRIVQL